MEVDRGEAGGPMGWSAEARILALAARLRRTGPEQPPEPVDFGETDPVLTYENGVPIVD